MYVYFNAICILSIGYFPISLIPISQLNEMLIQVKETVLKTDPNYDLVIRKLYLYYDR